LKIRWNSEGRVESDILIESPQMTTDR